MGILLLSTEPDALAERVIGEAANVAAEDVGRMGQPLLGVTGIVLLTPSESTLPSAL